MSNMKETIRKTENTLNEYHIFGDVHQHGDLPILVVTIHGDWKHDHLMAKHLLTDLGLIETNEITTETDGSDYYTAEHYFLVA